MPSSLRSAPPRGAQTPGTSCPFSSTSTDASPPGGGFDLDLLEERAGILIFRAEGRGAARAFAQECGGMRFQRVPPTEKRGRVHTSTVTVSVLPEAKQARIQIPERELRWTTCRAGGKGGQHVNKTNSAVQLTHLPTGTQLRVESTRSQQANKAAARAMLAERLRRAADEALRRSRASTRRQQVGTGMRGDKRRTIALQRDSVVDHQTGRRTTWRRYARGHIDDLWNSPGSGNGTMTKS